MTKFAADIQRTVRLVVPAAWTNNQRGEFLESVVARLLARQRYIVTRRVGFTGMEIDVLADHQDTRQRAFVECKFVRDPLSTNVVDSLLGKATRKGVDLAYLFSTASPGVGAKGAIDELYTAPPETGPRFIFVGPEELTSMFESVYNAAFDDRDVEERDSITSATLIITPDSPVFWLLEQHRDGVPYRGIIYPIQASDSVEPEQIVGLFQQNDLYQGLELVPYSTGKARSIREHEPDEIVTSVVAAESLDDYRPCRPQDFIGRYSAQRGVWSFLDRVRTSVTSTRIIALTGPSGFGKSSVVLKLADRFKNKKWRNEFFLFPVDARSARGPLFVPRAVRAAFQQMLEDGFVSIPESTVTVDSSESYLSSASIRSAIADLRKRKRVLIIFFDQFEELFTKDELLSTFEAFKRLAFEINAAAENVALGFSWRTGITFTDENPAYHLWHELRDHRFGLALERFERAETSQMVTQFEKTLGESLLPPLRRRLMEQGQGLPWLLKKLCIHVYRELRRGTRQEELLSRRLNVQALFDEDLEPLTPNQQQCLRYIAQHSPADILDVLEHYEQDTVNALYSRRLIVRAGPKYAVYWDIFRDYLVQGSVPAIPWTYVPQVEFSMAVKAFSAIQNAKSVQLGRLAEILKYKESTVANIITDLQNVLLAHRASDGSYRVRSDLSDASLMDVAGLLRSQFREHAVTQALYAETEPDEVLSMSAFRDLVARTYSSTELKSETQLAYTNRLLPWLRFVGIVELSEDQIIRPRDRGREFGLLQARRRADNLPRSGTHFFLGSAAPSRVVALACRLVRGEVLVRPLLSQSGDRNAAVDLVGLGLAKWEGDHLRPTEELGESAKEPAVEISRKLIGRAEDSRFLRTVAEVMAALPSSDNLRAGHELGIRLGREWTDASAVRNWSAGKTWIKFTRLNGRAQADLLESAPSSIDDSAVKTE